MKKIILNCLLICLILIFISCSNTSEPTNSDVSLDEKIGQMLMIGFRGLEVDTNSQIVKDLMNQLIGGVVLFDRDVALGSNIRNIQSPNQVSNLIQSLNKYSKQQIFVAVDQEGGKVNRLKMQYGFPYHVSQQYLGNLDNADSTAFYGNQTGKTLYNLGFNVNFAPVVDVNINPESPAIGKIERSFSANPDLVIKHSNILIDNLHQNNVLATLKHFPGHGSAGNDSHTGFTDVTNTWQESELIPYRELIKQNKADFVMTAHIFNSKLDPDYPATLSKKIIDGILRKNLQFDGVVISDDMNMKAITEYYGLESAIELSINAGVDILIFANNLIYDELIAQKAIDIVKEKIKSGKISINRINESYNRIIKLKKKLSPII